MLNVLRRRLPLRHAEGPPPAPLRAHGDGPRVHDVYAPRPVERSLVTFLTLDCVHRLSDGIVQKDGFGFDRAVEECKARMARYNVAPNMLIVRGARFEFARRTTLSRARVDLRAHAFSLRRSLPSSPSTCRSRPRRRLCTPNAKRSMPSASALFSPLVCTHVRARSQVQHRRAGRRRQLRGRRGGLHRARLPRPGRLHEHAGTRPFSHAV